jgi:orotidine-5'-phosphate decarboxylase
MDNSSTPCSVCILIGRNYQIILTAAGAAAAQIIIYSSLNGATVLREYAENQTGFGRTMTILIFTALSRIVTIKWSTTFATLNTIDVRMSTTDSVL